MSEKKYLSKKYTNMNIYLLLIGVLLIVVGYILLGVYKEPYDNFIAMNIVPIFLFLGYVVVIPVALLYKKPVEK